MSVIMIGDFGTDKEGVRTYRINATSQDDIYKLIDATRELGYKFWDTPNIQKVNKTYSVLLKLYIPKDLGYPEESSS